MQKAGAAFSLSPPCFENLFFSEVSLKFFLIICPPHFFFSQIELPSNAVASLSSLI